jgi:hypothetical protein
VLAPSRGVNSTLAPPGPSYAIIEHLKGEAATTTLPGNLVDDRAARVAHFDLDTTAVVQDSWQPGARCNAAGGRQTQSPNI